MKTQISINIKNLRLNGHTSFEFQTRNYMNIKNIKNLYFDFNIFAQTLGKMKNFVINLQFFHYVYLILLVDERGQ